MKAYLFGQYLLDRGTVTPEQLYDGLEYQRRGNRVLGEIAMEEGLLDKTAVRRIIGCQLSQDKDFGQVAVEMGLIGEDDRRRLLQIQEDRHIYLGDALVQTGALTRAELDSSLADFRLDVGESVEEGLATEMQGEEPVEAFLDLFSKLLPRLTGGAMIPGGYYPTISAPDFSYACHQVLDGENGMDVALLLPEEVFDRLGEETAAVLPLPGYLHGRRKRERAVRSFLSQAVGIYAANLGEPEALRGGARKLSAGRYRARRDRYRDVTCVEIFLIAPPAPEGDFYQLNVCVMTGPDKES